MERVRWHLLAPLLVLGLLAWGCSGAGGGPAFPDTTLDTVGDDTGADTVPDAPADTPTDTDTDTDAGEGPDTVTPFIAGTSGGARLSSPGYSLELFIAPVGPVGGTSSTNFDLKLGPAGARSN